MKTNANCYHGYRFPPEIIVDAGLRDVWIPLRVNQGHSNCYELLARLAPGASVEQARAEIQTLMTLGPEDQLARVEARKRVVTQGFGTPLLLLLGGAAPPPSRSNNRASTFIRRTPLAGERRARHKLP